MSVEMLSSIEGVKEKPTGEIEPVPSDSALGKRCSDAECKKTYIRDNDDLQEFRRTLKKNDGNIHFKIDYDDDDEAEKECNDADNAGENSTMKRERNKIHSRQTRLRRKKRSVELVDKVVALQDEAKRLQFLYDEMETANILLCLCVEKKQNSAPPQNSFASLGIDYQVVMNGSDIIASLKKKVNSEAPETFERLYCSSMESLTTENSTENSDSDHYHSFQSEETKEEQRKSEKESTGLDLDQCLKSAKNRKEKNRIHSKLTRIRRKLLMKNLEVAARELESNNKKMQMRINTIINDNISNSQKKDKMNILLVDDSVVVQKVVKNMLESKGFDVDISMNGLQCLHAMDKTMYDLVLMDLEMPVMNGIDAMRNIRKNERNLEQRKKEEAESKDSRQHTSIIPITSIDTEKILIPQKESFDEQYTSTKGKKRTLIIAMSSVHSVSVAELYDAGADAFLCKPFDSKIFDNTVERLRADVSATAH